ncbi:MAG: hypothetical protein PVF20_04230 [Desulfobacterales bacterium]|jgi:hypothetical protein
MLSDDGVTVESEGMKWVPIEYAWVRKKTGIRKGTPARESAPAYVRIDSSEFRHSLFIGFFLRSLLIYEVLSMVWVAVKKRVVVSGAPTEAIEACKERR